MTSSKTSAVERATIKLRGAILSGQYAIASSLPGERELAESLGVSRLTLRAALSQLRAEGLVAAVPGSGNRVLDYRETGSLEVLGHVAQLVVQDGVVPTRLLQDLLELRRVMLVEAWSLAAVRATTSERASLAAHVDVLEAHARDPHAFIASDIQFGRLLMRATHNLGFDLLHGTLARMVQQQAAFWPAFLVQPKGTIKAYRTMARALEARDRKRMRVISQRELEKLDRRTLRLLAPRST